MSSFGYTYSFSGLLVVVFVAYADALLNPIAYISQLDRHTQQLEILTEDFETDVSDLFQVSIVFILCINAIFTSLCNAVFYHV